MNAAPRVAEHRQEPAGPVPDQENRAKPQDRPDTMASSGAKMVPPCINGISAYIAIVEHELSRITQGWYLRYKTYCIQATALSSFVSG